MGGWSARNMRHVAFPAVFTREGPLVVLGNVIESHGLSHHTAAISDLRLSS